MQGGKQEPLGFGRGVRLCSGLTEVVKSDLWCGHSAGLFGASRQVHAIGFCRIGDWRFSVEASDLASAVCPRGWRGGEGGEGRGGGGRGGGDRHILYNLPWLRGRGTRLYLSTTPLTNMYIQRGV